MSVSLLLQGCDFAYCGFYSTTRYDSELVVLRAFRDIEIASGDSIEFRPEDNVEIQYYYTGSENCEGEDYTDDPRFEASVEDDSVASVTKFWTGEHPGQGEQRFRISPKKSGSTRLLLKAEWEQEGKTDAILRDQSFEINLVVF